jgi:hypothetical protein
VCLATELHLPEDYPPATLDVRVMACVCVPLSPTVDVVDPMKRTARHANESSIQIDDGGLWAEHSMTHQIDRHLHRVSKANDGGGWYGNVD